MLAVPPATIEIGSIVNEEAAAEIAAGVTVTTPVCVTAIPPMVADTVLLPLSVELSVPVATPLASVTADGIALFPAPVAANATVAPAMGLLLASRAVTVMVLALEPVLAVIVLGETPSVLCAAETAPGTTVIAVVPVRATPPATAEIVLVSAVLEETEPVAIPLASVIAGGCPNELFVPVALSTTVTPGTTLLKRSRT